MDIEINESDLRVDAFRSSGPGVVCDTTILLFGSRICPRALLSASRMKNHKKPGQAMKILRARLYDAERARQQAERAASRKGQVGSGDRSERIRTYNFPQGRVTDHRINLTLYKLDKILAGESLEEVVDALAAEDQAARLAEGQETI